jgi:hypothetical protein
LIPFLDQGHYFGLEGEKALVDSGLREELLFNVAEFKSPNFAFNYEFNLDFIDSFDFAIAQSLFTHLNDDDIERCFSNLAKKSHKNSLFYFTFFEGDSASNIFDQSHPNRAWKYSPEEIFALAEGAGWEARYIGDWGHPRHQKLGVAKLKLDV